jgi:hypothetical protein
VSFDTLEASGGRTTMIDPSSPYAKAFLGTLTQGT